MSKAPEIPTTLHDWLTSPHLRKRPGMYLMQPTLTSLQLYVYGYESCLNFRKISREGEPDWNAFYEFLLGVFNESANSMGWLGLITNHCGGDEELALKEFFTLYDRFVRLTENNGGEQVSDE